MLFAKYIVILRLLFYLNRRYVEETYTNSIIADDGTSTKTP